MIAIILIKRVDEINPFRNEWDEVLAEYYSAFTAIYVHIIF